MLLGYASNLPFDPLSIPRPISYHHGPALCPKDCPLWVASLVHAGSGSGQQRHWKEIKDEERKEEESSASLFPSGSGLHFLAMAESLQGCSSCQRAPPLWPQLSPWTPGMNAISSLCSWPSSDSSFPLLLVSGWQEPHVTLNSVYSSGNNPFIKVFWTIYIGLFLLPDLRIQTTDL